MSVELKSGEKIAALKQGIEGVTGETYADLTEAVNGLKEQQYEAGKKAEYDAFWDEFQAYGETTSYDYAFYRLHWNDKNFYPKYDINVIIPTGVHSYTFANNAISDLAGRLTECGVKLDTSNNTRFSYMFYGSRLLTHVPEIDMRKATYTVSMFASNTALHTIDKMIFAEGGINYDMTFNGCSALKNIIIEGLIGENWNMKDCKELTADSLQSVAYHLKNYKGTDKEGVYALKLHADAWVTLEATTPPAGYDSWRDYVMDLGWGT